MKDNEFNVGWGGAEYLEKYPFIEEALYKLIWRIDFNSMMISDLSNLYHVVNYEIFNDRIKEFFGFQISEDEFEELEIKDFILKFLDYSPDYNFDCLARDLEKLKSNTDEPFERSGYYTCELMQF